jgi:hypothetical protein
MPITDSCNSACPFHRKWLRKDDQFLNKLDGNWQPIPTSNSKRYIIHVYTFFSPKKDLVYSLTTKSSWKSCLWLSVHGRLYIMQAPLKMSWINIQLVSLSYQIDHHLANLVPPIRLRITYYSDSWSSGSWVWQPFAVDWINKIYCITLHQPEKTNNTTNAQK